MAEDEDESQQQDELPSETTQSAETQSEMPDSGEVETASTQSETAQREDTQLGSIIDEDGKLFGLVNVVDALVVVLVAAIIIAGVALLLPSGEDDTRYVTVDLGAESEHVAEQISEGDQWGNNFEVTDVYYSPAEASDETNILLRAEVQGTVVGPEQADTSTIDFDGEPLRYDRELEIETSQYAVTGSVVDVSTDGDTITTANESMVVEAEVDTTTANRITEGDEYTVGGQTLLTVQSVTAYPTGDSDTRHLVLGIDGVELRDDGGTLRIGGTQATSGETVPIRTGNADINAEILQTGTFEEPGEERIITVEYETEGLSTEQANRLEEGLTESADGLQTAEIAEVQGSGADRTLILSLTVRELDGENGSETFRFRGQELVIGDEPTFDFGGIIPPVNGEITNMRV